MKIKSFIILLTFILILTSGFYVFDEIQDNNTIISYQVNLKKQNLKLYWKDQKGAQFRSLLNLKTYLENRNQKLLFAMNGGMFKKDNSPQGLFIQDFKNLATIDTANGNGNFYLKPNGIFYITEKDQGFICKTEDYPRNKKVKYATQSGPMLVIDGQIHKEFKEGSTNLNIRDGVGILPNDQIIFAMSKTEINFYDFARYFQKLGCKNALYLDGFVSRTYLPEKKWVQTDGDFGVIIGVSANK